MNATDSNKPNFIKDASSNKPFYRSMMFRVFALMLLLTLMIIPITMLKNMVDEHILKEQTNIGDMTKSWGNEQIIIGPILSIPYVERIRRIESQTDSNGVKSSVSRDVFSNKTLMLLPENLSIKAELKDKLLKNDKFMTNVYQGEIELSGNFDLDSLPEPSGNNSIEWDKAYIAIGLNDNKSVEASTPLRWEGSSAAFKPGTQLPKLIKNGIHASLEEVANENPRPKFKVLLNLKGLNSFQFAPFGQLSTANISTNWTNTDVHGDILASSKVSSAEGFVATWRISNLARNYPQQWLIEDDQKDKVYYDFKSLLTGVELKPSKTTSNNKTSKIKIIISNLLLVLGIIYLSILILEFKRNSRSRPKFIHYLIISLPIIMTPLLLLTLQYMMSFTQSYQMVAATCIFLIVLFTLSITKSFTYGFYLLLILVSIYAAQFINIEMPEYSLFATSAAGVWITILMMLMSFNIKEDK